MLAKGKIHNFEFVCSSCGYIANVAAYDPAEAVKSGFQLHDIRQRDSKMPCYNNRKKCGLRQLKTEEKSQLNLAFFF